MRFGYRIRHQIPEEYCGCTKGEESEETRENQQRDTSVMGTPRVPPPSPELDGSLLTAMPDDVDIGRACQTPGRSVITAKATAVARRWTNSWPGT